MPGLSNLADSIRDIMELLLSRTEADALLMVTMTEEEPHMVSVDTALASPTDVVEREGLPYIIARAAEEDIRAYDDHPEEKEVRGVGAYEDDPIMRPDPYQRLAEPEPEYDGFEEPEVVEQEDGLFPEPALPSEATFYVEVEMWPPQREGEGQVTVTERANGNAEEIVAHLRRIADDIERDVL